MVHSAWGILLASDKTQQLSNGTDVGFLSVGTDPVITYSLMAFERCPDIDGLIVVASKDRMESLRGLAQIFGCSKLRKIVPGTTQRPTSLLAGLDALEDTGATLATIHDVCRPCVKSEIFSQTIKSAKRYGSGVAAVQLAGSVAVAEKGLAAGKSLDGKTLWSVLTPQTYRLEYLRKGLAAAAKKKISLNDECEAMALAKQELRLVPSDPHNIRIDTPEDLSLASSLVRL